MPKILFYMPLATVLRFLFWLCVVIGVSFEVLKWH